MDPERLNLDLGVKEENKKNWSMPHEALWEVLSILNSWDRIFNDFHKFKMFSQNFDQYLLKDFPEGIQ